MVHCHLYTKADTNDQISHDTIIDLNEVDMRIYLPEKVIIHRGRLA